MRKFFLRERGTILLKEDFMGILYNPMSSMETYFSSIYQPTVRSFFGQIRLRSRMPLMSIRHFHMNKLACASAS